MDADRILSNLDKVRASGDRAWMACCPAHEDRNPSMRIADKGDRILLHCYAGCDPHVIVASMGLQWSDLFADGKDHWSPRMKLDRAITERDEAALVLQMCRNKRDRGEHLNGYELLEEHEAGERLRKYT